MRNKIIPVGCALVLGAGLAMAAPGYKTVSGYGNSAAGAIAYFPSDPNSQIRIVNLFLASDNAGAQLLFTTGTTAFNETLTNYATSLTAITNCINSTNGLSVGAMVVLEHNGLPYTNSVVTWNQNTNSIFGTNVVLATGGWNVLPSVNDNIYVMSAATAVAYGANTNSQSGAAIYVGNYGRPVQAWLQPATATNRIYAASAHYDSASQP